MKRQTTFIAVAFAIFGLCISAQAQMDLTMKPGIYLTGSKFSIDESKDRYVAKNSRVDVFTDEATKFENGQYWFHMGVILTRSGKVSSYLSTYGNFTSTTGAHSGNSTHFQPGRGWARLVVPVKLSSGANRIVFAVDPYQKTIESDETNNTFWVIVVVNQRFPSGGPK